MTNLEQLRNNYVIAYRAYCDKWCEIYEEWKNVSYADKKTLTTEEGLNYLITKLNYEEEIKKRG